MYYVYSYNHPVNKYPVYIGKGQGHRYRQHLKGGCNKSFQEFIKSFSKEDIEKNLEIIFRTEDESSALSTEEFLINSYGLQSEGGLLFNKLKKTSSNTQVVLDERVIKLLGTMTDRELSEISGINWSTLRDKRNAMGIKSFKEKYQGTPEYSEKYLKPSEVISLYDTNGRVYRGTRRDLCEDLGISNVSLGSVVRSERNHIKGYFLAPTEKVTPQTTFNFNKDDETFTGTYHEFSSAYNIPYRSVRNACTGHRKDIKGWVAERVIYE